MNPQPLYDLTKMTGRKASEDRTVVIGYTEMRWRTFIIGAVGFVAGIFMSLFFYPLLGGWVIITVIPATIAAVLWLVEGRSKKGLQRRHYEAIIDRKQAIINRFMVGPLIVKVPEGDWLRVRSGTLDVPHGEGESDKLEALVAQRQTTVDSVGAVNDIFGG